MLLNYAIDAGWDNYIVGGILAILGAGISSRAITFMSDQVGASKTQRVALIPYIYLLIIFCSVIYGYFLESYGLRVVLKSVVIAFYPIAVATLFLVLESDQERRLLSFEILLLSVVVYVVVNVILKILGFEPTKHIFDYSMTGYGKAKILGLLGMSADRDLFPLTSGLTTFGAISGLSTLICFYFLRSSKNGYFLLISMVGMLLSLYALTISDARAAIAWVMVLILLELVIKKKYKPLVVKSILVVSIFFPFVLSAVSGYLASKDAMSTVSRNDSSIGTLNGRVDIWNVVLDRTSVLSLHTIVGWGFEGHKTSGMSDIYKKYFGLHRLHADKTTTHNMSLQLFVDVGLIGIFAWVLLIWSLVRTIELRKLDRRLYMLLAFFLLIGATDAAPTIYQPDLMMAFAIIVLGIGSLQSNSRRNRHPQMREVIQYKSPV